ncbi:hypothetical protein V8C35DRAFT_308166 [Trichoderma chlorosporum]
MDQFELLRPIPEPPGPPDPKRHVVLLERWCRACGETFSSGESIVSVSEDDEAIRVVCPQQFPGDQDRRLSPRESRRRSFFNWDRFDVTYEEEPESATIHTDCFNLFRRSCTDEQAIHRLLLAAVWRSPWAGAAKFEVATTYDVTGLIQLAAKACDMPRLETMPTELKGLVWQELITQPSTVTRYHSVMSLAADSSRQDFNQQATVPIGNVGPWERGQAPANEEQDLAPFIRITIDSQGLKRIERLAQRPELISQASDTELYIVENQADLESIKVQFQSGLARLKWVRYHDLDPVPWDTPTPPDVDHLITTVHSNRPPSTRVAQFSTIDVSKITGITFFMTWEAQEPEFFIHAHTRNAPSARSTYDRLSAQDWSGVWYYIPFPSRDRLTSFGVRYTLEPYPAVLQLLFHFEKAGDFAVGLPSPRNLQYDEKVWLVGDQLQLVCGLSQSGRAVTLDAHPKGLDAEFPTPAPPIGQQMPEVGGVAFVSWAPLEHVACVRTFTDEDAGICRGYLLEYENGAQRSLGECRVGIDVERAYVKPICLCINKSFNLRRWRLKVRVDGQWEHGHTEEGWSCHEMRGTLISWCMRGYHELRVVVDDDESA